MKEQLGKLLGPARAKRLAHSPMPKQRTAQGTLPEDGTGWTLHRDVALRLKSISVDEPGGSLGNFVEAGAFKIRLADSPQVRGDAAVLVQQRYARKGYRTTVVKVGVNVCTFAAYDKAALPAR